MGTLDWRPFADIDSVRLQEARLQAHHAVQWLARAARAFVPALADDSHTNLGWEHDFGGFATHKLQGARVGLKLAPLTLALLQGTAGTTTRTFVLAGRTEADARAWLGQEMNGLGLDARKLDIELPYQLPFHEIANGGTYASSGIDDALHELSTWYANADQSLYRLREAMSGKNLNASPVRCWPHHFDLATLIA